MLPSEPKPATAEAQALLRAAERDWKTVELLLQHPDAPVSSVCFHAQQFINSPYTEPSRHWRYERETRAFSLAEGRRPAGNVVLYVKKQPAFSESKFIIEKRADLLSDVESRTLSSIIMTVLLERSRG